VTDDARCERTARILSAHLDELARTLERAAVPRDVATRLLESASIATMHAVTLELLSPSRAADPWQEAAEQHPSLPTPRFEDGSVVLEKAAA
jgi:hypothetical protein